jgi:hypothetical protein
MIGKSTIATLIATSTAIATATSIVTATVISYKYMLSTITIYMTLKIEFDSV